MRVKITVISLKKRATQNIDEEGIFIQEGDTFAGYIDPAFPFLNLRYTKNEEYDPTNFTAFGKIIDTGDGGVVFTKFGTFVVQEVEHGRHETLGYSH